MKLAILRGEFPADLICQVDPVEGATVRDLMARGEFAMVCHDENRGLLGYAVFGLDTSQIVTVYAARSKNSMLAKAAMIGIFGAAQVMGKPVRVHTEKLRAMARMMGADFAIPSADMDGLPMGIFSNGV